jgi:peptidoglycan/LPS O-acetylase OafA/YrhL
MDFLVARFSRLYPAYWTGVLLTSLVLWVAGSRPGLRQIGANLSMLQEFFGVSSVDGAYWTLEVELLFYGLALGVFRPRMLPRAHLLIAGWLALSALCYGRLLPAYLGEQPFMHIAARLLVLEYAPFFAAGILFYRVYRGQGSGRWNYSLIAAALALIFLTWPLDVALMIAAACVILWKVGRGGVAVLRFRPLLFFGTISYPLYLVHQRIGYAVLLALARHGWSPALRVAAASALVTGLATAITFVVERPAMHAIRRYYKGARRSAISGPAPA